jgi:hypothetical protein
MQDTLAVVAGPSAERGSYAHWFACEADVRGEMVLSTDPYPVRFASTKHRKGVYLFADQNFEFVRHDTGAYAGQFKIHTLGYVYTVSLADNIDQGLTFFHWHPRDRQDPHVHLRTDDPNATTAEGVHGLHIPTGRVSFETVVRFLIDEFAVRPASGWEKRLEVNEDLFRRHRTWG